MWLRRNAQLSQEYNGLKWHHHQQQEQLQRLLQQSPAPKLVNSPAGVIVMPPPSPAQVDDFFGALAALGDTSEQPGATETSAAAEDSGVGTASHVADNSSAGFPHGVASVGPASAPSLPPSSPSHELFASHSPISNPASLAAACSATPNSSYILSTPPLFSTGQRAVIVGVTSALDGTLAAPCDKEY